MLAVSLAFARLVVEPNTPQPMLEEEAVLVVQRHDVNLGCDGPGDAGVPDAATGDAGTPDAGVPGDAGTCEPITGDAITMTVRPRFSADPMGTRFALLFVTPSRPIVETTEDTFAELARLSAPRTEVHEHEVPTRSLGTQCSQGCGAQSNSNSGGGCEYDGSYYDPPPVGDGGLGDGGAVVETVGPYEVVRVQPADPQALAALLDSFHYQYKQEDLDAVAPYIARGYTVVAVRLSIDSHELKSIPLAMTWAGTELKLPVGLGDASPENLQTYLIADGRYEFADAIVRFAGFTFGPTGGFLTVNRLAPTVSTGPDEDPVAHHVLGDEEFQEVDVIDRDVPVPVEDCSGEGDDSGGCCRECNARGSVRPDWAMIGLVVAVLLRPRRKRPTSSR